MGKSLQISKAIKKFGTLVTPGILKFRNQRWDLIGDYDRIPLTASKRRDLVISRQFMRRSDTISLLSLTHQSSVNP